VTGATETRALGRLPFRSAEALLLAAGLHPAHRDPEAAAFHGPGGLIWLLRDAATGNLLVTGRDLPPLPSPPAGEVAALLIATDPRDNLAGLQLARSLLDPALLAPAFLLLAHPDPVVSAAARDWLSARSASGTLLAGVDAAAALFAVPGQRREKLQTMRWWMQDRPTDPSRIAGALDRALADPDWEIAVTAMLAAGTLRLTALRRAVAGARLPETKAEGVTHDEARLILALRDATLVRLGGPPGKAVPQGVEAVLDGDPDGLPPGLCDVAAALSQPLPVGTPPEPAAGVILGPAGPTRADGSLLTWVPPATYRLGTTLAPRGAVSNPPHRVALARGFYIDTEPRPPLPFAAARAEAQRLGASLPTPDQWEMAARGADGRRYVFGMNAGVPGDLSPLGLAGTTHGPGEWLDTGPDTPPLVAGGAPAAVAIRRSPVTDADSRSFRLILMV
jgi:hypothetical protein